MRKSILALSAALLLAIPVQAALAKGGKEARVEVGQNPEYGSYLVDSEGYALYMFEADRQGTGQIQAESNCYGECAQAWPPLTAAAMPELGLEAEAELLGTIQRADGSTQVTYNGWPLYYYERDQQPGAITGQDVLDGGAEWYLVSPEGQKIDQSGDDSR